MLEKSLVCHADMLLKNRGEQVSSNTNQHAKVLPGFEPRRRLRPGSSKAAAQTNVSGSAFWLEFG